MAKKPTLEEINKLAPKQGVPTKAYAESLKPIQAKPKKEVAPNKSTQPKITTRTSALQKLTKTKAEKDKEFTQGVNALRGSLGYESIEQPKPEEYREPKIPQKEAPNIQYKAGKGETSIEKMVRIKAGKTDSYRPTIDYDYEKIKAQAKKDVENKSNVIKPSQYGTYMAEQTALASEIGGAYAKVKPEVAEATKKSIENYFNSDPIGASVMENFMTTPLTISTEKMMESKIGDINTAKARQGTGYVATEFVGQMAQFLIPYASVGGAMEGWLNKTFNVAMKQFPQQVVAEQALVTMPKVINGLKKFGVEAVKDIAIGIPINTKIGLELNYEGEELAKFVAVNSAFDLILGGAIQGVPALFRFSKLKLSQKEQMIARVADELGMEVGHVRKFVDYNLAQENPLYASKENVNKILKGEKLTDYDTPEDIRKRQYELAQQPTSIKNDVERAILRNDIVTNVLSQGSAVRRGGEFQNTGKVKQERVLNIVTGNTGKSTLANFVSKETGSRILDVRAINRMIPESMNGKYTAFTLDEASTLLNDAFDVSMRNGDNMVLVMDGTEKDFMSALASFAKDNGYSVNLKNVDMPIEEATARAIKKYQTTGIYTDPYHLTEGVGNRPKDVYSVLEKEGVFDSYEQYANDVREGKKPRRVESFGDSTVRTNEQPQPRSDAEPRQGATEKATGKPEEPAKASPEVKTEAKPKTAEKPKAKEVEPKETPKTESKEHPKKQRGNKGEKTREVKIDGKKVSQTYSNTYKKYLTMPDMKGFQMDDFTYEVESNKVWAEKAYNNILNDFDGVLKRVLSDKAPDGGIETHENAIITHMIRQNAEETGDYSLYAKVTQAVAKNTRESARSLQAMSQAWKSSPDGAIIKMQRDLLKYVDGQFESNPALKKQIDKEAKELKEALKLKKKEAKVKEDEAFNKIKSHLKEKNIDVETFYDKDVKNNGSYMFDEKTGRAKISINTNGHHPLMTILRHELAHSIWNSPHYDSFAKEVNSVANKYIEANVARGGKTKKQILSDMKEAYAEQYAKEGRVMTDEELEDEFVAHFVQDFIMKDYNRILELITKKRTFADELYDNIAKFKSWLTDTGDLNKLYDYKSTMKEIDRIERAFSRAYLKNSALNKPDVKGEFYLFGSENSPLADSIMLGKAKTMVEYKSNADIFAETGWFKGVDGKWRFEIDDSKFGYKQEYMDKLTSLTQRMKKLTSEKTETDPEEFLKQFSEINYEIQRTLNYAINDIEHSELFKAYPQYRQMVRAEFADLQGAVGSFNKQTNEIQIKRGLPVNDAMNVHLHEIQHFIQKIEKLASGGDAGKNTRLQIVASLRQEGYIRQKISNNQTSFDNGWTSYDDYMKHKIEYEKDLVQYTAITSKIKTKSVDKLDRMGQSIPKEDVDTVYYMTAGEIEARDVQARMAMDSITRRQTLPVLGSIKREDVVFNKNDHIYISKNPDFFDATNYDVDPEIFKKAGYAGSYDGVTGVAYGAIEGRFIYPTKKLLQEVYDNIRVNYGDTVTTEGRRPSDGFMMAIDKKYESVYDLEDFKIKDITEWLNRTDVKLALMDKRNFIGAWLYSGKVYMDVSRRFNPSFKTILDAYKQGELAVFDMNTFKTVRTSWIRSYSLMNRFTHINETEFRKAFEKHLPNVEMKFKRHLYSNEDVFGGIVPSGVKGKFGITQKRLNEAIEDYSTSSPTSYYSHGYMTKMSPEQFLSLTASKRYIERISKDMNDWDYYDETFRNSKMIYLGINPHTGKVEGHEGRHRMFALMNSGVKEIPVFLRTKPYGTDTDFIKSLKLTGQDFGVAKAEGTVDVNNLYPVNEKYRADLEREFVNAPAEKRYLRGSEDFFNAKDSEGYDVSPAMAEYMKDAKVRDKNGNLIPYYHGTFLFTPVEDQPFEHFYNASHFGTKGQANYFASSASRGLARNLTANNRVYPVYLNIKKPVRYVDDNVSSWMDRVEEAKQDGYDGIVYLNRYEGIRDKTTGADITDNPQRQEELMQEYADSINKPYYGGMLSDITDEEFLKVFDADDSYIVFNPEQAKGVFNERPTKDPRVMYLYGGHGQGNFFPNIYSQLDKSIDEDVPEFATPKEYLEALKKAGVTENELNDSGMTKFLTTGVIIREDYIKSTDAVISKEVLRYVYDKNNVDIEIIHKSEANFKKEPVLTKEQEVELYMLEQNNNFVQVEFFNGLLKYNLIEDNIEGYELVDRASNYLLEFKSDFLETNVKNGKITEAQAEELKKLVNEMSNAKFDLYEFKKKFKPSENLIYKPVWDRVSIEGGNGDYKPQNYQELVFRVKDDSTKYAHYHWDNPVTITNPMSHARTSDYQVVDPSTGEFKTTLFVMELQSDWWQKSRSMGAGESLMSLNGKLYHIPKTWKFEKEALVSQAQKPAFYNLVNKKGEVMGSGKTKYEAFIDAGMKSNFDPSEIVSNMPVMENDWLKYSLKSLIDFAVANGYRAISFPTGRLVPKVERLPFGYDDVLNNEKYKTEYMSILNRYDVDIPQFVGKYLRQWKTHNMYKHNYVLGREWRADDRTDPMNTFFLNDKVKEDISTKGQKKYAYGDFNFEDLMGVPKEKQPKRKKPKSFLDFDADTSEQEILDYVKRKHGIPTLSEDEIEWMYEKSVQAQKMPLDSYEQRRANAELAQFIGNKIPADGIEKLKAVQRIFMLLNLKSTITRNGLGNVLLNTLEEVRYIPSTVLDTIVSGALKTDRTTTVSLGRYAEGILGAGQGLEEWAKDINLDLIKKEGFRAWVRSEKAPTVPTGGQMDITHRSEIFNMNHQGRMAGARNKLSYSGNTLHETVAYGMRLLDTPFYTGAYRARIAELKKLNKTYVVTEAMREDAKLTALERTLQNDSFLAKKFAKFGNDETDQAWWRVTASMLMPFRKTPANILDKVIDYSPFGIFKSISYGSKVVSGVKKGVDKSQIAFDQKKFVDTLGRTLTGTGLVWAGFAMAQNGWITGSKQQNDPYGDVQTSLGSQNYAFNVYGEYHPFNWALPASSPIAMGADIYFGRQKNQDKKGAFMSGLESSINMIMATTLLQNVMRLTSGYNPSTSIIQTAVGTSSQAVPTVAGQFRQWADPYKRDTYDKNLITKQKNLLLNRIPFASRSLPLKPDVFGRPQRYYEEDASLGKKIFDIFLSPAPSTTYKADNVQKEIVRLYQSEKNSEMLPKYLEKYIDETKQNPRVDLNNEQYSKYQTLYGKYAMESYKKFMDDPLYKGLSDKAKAEALAKRLARAKKQAKEELLKELGY